MTNTPPTAPTPWHRLLGEVLEKLLTPVGLSVYTELSLMSRPPRADVLILRRKQARWTVAQLERLPDGVRDSQASHILLEFKYTESLSAEALQQALAYDLFYRQTQELTHSDVQTFLLCAKQPLAKHLTEYGYVKTSLPGVYRSDWYSWLPPVTLLSLNELSHAPHNAWVKCFASQLKEKRKAFTILQQLVTTWKLPRRLIFFIDALRALWFPCLFGGIMKSKLIDEDLTDVGPHWKQIVLQALTIEDMLAYFPPKDVLAKFKPADLLAHFKPKDVVAQFKPADLLAQFKPADLLAHFKPADVLAQLNPEDIENYLTHLKQSPRAKTVNAKPKPKKRK
jgi:hypothetical protein